MTYSSNEKCVESAEKAMCKMKIKTKRRGVVVQRLVSVEQQGRGWVTGKERRGYVNREQSAANCGGAMDVRCRSHYGSVEPKPRVENLVLRPPSPLLFILDL